jgi:hypothetical protein
LKIVSLASRVSEPCWFRFFFGAPLRTPAWRIDLAAPYSYQQISTRFWISKKKITQYFFGSPTSQGSQKT